MPLLSNQVRERIPWTQLAVESVLVVLSVLMALALDAWYDHSQEQEKVRRALRSIHAELVDVRGPMADRVEYHAALVDTFRTDTLSFEQPLALRYVDPATDAWHTAQQTGAVAFMDYETAQPISAAYSQAEDLQFLINKSYDLLFDGVRYRGMSPNNIDGFGGYLSDLQTKEKIYLEKVDRAIATIERRMPSLPAAPDTSASSSSPPSDS